MDRRNFIWITPVIISVVLPKHAQASVQEPEVPEKPGLPIDPNPPIGPPVQPPVQPPPIEPPPIDPAPLYCELEDNEIHLCHISADDPPETLCLAPQGAENGHLKKHEDDYLGPCKVILSST